MKLRKIIDETCGKHKALTRNDVSIKRIFNLDDNIHQRQVINIMNITISYLIEKRVTTAQKQITRITHPLHGIVNIWKWQPRQ